jgi:6-pyruvoyltetrahydropterin/6-carboxytetrahydropterin synthase
MQQHRVTKVIDFCYGHRLLNHGGKCRYLHGHNGLLEVEVEGETLNSLGLVIDFGDIQDMIKGWVDTNLDHKMVLSRRDPVAPLLKELGEPLYLMDENPSAENLSKLIYQQARSQGLMVSEVRLWETPSSCAAYRGG